MPNPTEISLHNYNLEAKACNELLTAMLNHSDFLQGVSSTVTRTRPSISVIVFGQGLISLPTAMLMRKSTRL
nr:hypothetical protein [Ruminococcus sp.]